MPIKIKFDVSTPRDMGALRNVQKVALDHERLQFQFLLMVVRMFEL